MTGAELIARFLHEYVKHVFALQGGAVVRILDACERDGPLPIYCHHEQACGFAARAYSNLHGFGVCITTTGPAATNALTPLLGAWQDSIPCLFISGQQRLALTSYGKPVRQVGTQEAPIVDIVQPITKLAMCVTNPDFLRKALQDCFAESRSGRPGPVWLDVPLDIQYAEVA